MLLFLASLAIAPIQTGTQGPADSSRTISGVTLPGTVTVDGTTLHLNGASLRKKVIFKVYVAGLYVVTPAKTASAILGADEPRQMVMHFVRSVDKGKICDAWDEGLKDNTPDASEELKKEFTQLCDLTTDIKDGESFVFTYVPGKGTTVEVAGQEKGTIGGRDLADAMLRCWIGPKPGPGDGFKKNILGTN